jgi:hypothetical protein
MNIKELISKDLKAAFGSRKARFRYHNKNKSGGNFTIELIGLPNRDWDLHGEYNRDGKLYSLRFGPLFSYGHDIPCASKEIAFEYIRRILEIQREGIS